MERGEVTKLLSCDEEEGVEEINELKKETGGADLTSKRN